MKKTLQNKLQQLFAANQTAKKPNTMRVVKNTDDSADIYLYDAIGGWYGITAEDFAKALSDIDASTINLRINSPGGDVFEARAIQVALRQHSAKVIAHIDGIAASAATFVALAADELVMAEGAFFMIHNAWTIGMGNANEFEEIASMLHKVDGTIAKDYQRKTGVEAKQIQDWMDAETWFTADEAKEHGFIDEIYTGETVEDNTDWDLSAYSNTPANFKKAPTENPEPDLAQANILKNKLLRRVDVIDATAN